jgi:STE24 endopeptidase
MEWNLWTGVFAAGFFLHNGFELVLEILQGRHLKNRKDKVPKHLEGKVDLDTIRKAVLYNRDKIHLAMVSRLTSAIAVWAMILFGFGLVDGLASRIGGGTLTTGLLFFGILGVLGFAWGLPIELVSVFAVETKHGFNRRKTKDFALDKLKEVALSAALGAVLLAVVLELMGKGGSWWWALAFGCVALIQFLVAWIYPVAIMPMFNRFRPVEPDLAGDVSDLAGKVGFPLAGVTTMDGSKRSEHSNAFIVGLKGKRRIVLYDTLINKISREGLLAVLAHEFGHFKLKHLRKRLVLIVLSLFALFAALAYIKEQSAVYLGLGFRQPSDWAAIVVFGLLVSEVIAPFGWLLRFLSRRDELAADRFAVQAVGNGNDLADALVGLTKQNLSSPGSHRLYRSYYNSHPSLKRRLKAIKEHARALNSSPEPPGSDDGERKA